MQSGLTSYTNSLHQHTLLSTITAALLYIKDTLLLQSLYCYISRTHYYPQLLLYCYISRTHYYYNHCCTAIYQGHIIITITAALLYIKDTLLLQSLLHCYISRTYYYPQSLHCYISRTHYYYNHCTAIYQGHIIITITVLLYIKDTLLL